MNKLTDAANRYLKDCSWKDIAVLKFCLIALGVLLGIALPARNKKASARAASLPKEPHKLPLMAKFLPYLAGDKVAIEDIYGGKQL